MNQIRIFDESFRDLLRNKIEFLKISTEDVDESREELKKWTPSTTSKLLCSYCKIEFDDVAQQREHYKLDWHRYNLKQNLFLKPPVTEEEFNDKADSVSSISGSDSEKEDNLESVATLQGELFLKSDESVFSLYRCVLFEKKDELDDSVLLRRLRQLNANSQWTVLMLGGGHFAGGVFQGSTPIVHKTFHAYIVRSGQGGSQSSRDNRSGGFQPKSAGASLRRYNELALTQHIREIVQAWQPEIEKSNIIVYRATGPFNQSILFGGKVPVLNRSDSRLKTIPFATKRPTFTELKRVHSLLTTVTVYESHDHVNSMLKQETTKRGKVKTTNVNRAKSREDVQRPSPVKLEESAIDNEYDRNIGADLICYDEEIMMERSLKPFQVFIPEEAKSETKSAKKRKPKNKREQRDSNRRKIFCEIIKRGNLNELDSYLNRPTDDSTQRDAGSEINRIDEVLDEFGNTPLHLAALHQQLDVVTLLLEKGADPCLRNQKRHTPYSCTQDKDVRAVFKNFAEKYPEKHNYSKAQIPIPVKLTEEEIEKRKLLKKLKKEKEKEKKKEIRSKEQEEVEKQRFMNLSDREKRALAAERRILSQSGDVISRCFLCASNMAGKVPFEYSGNRFCSIDCLKAHRVSNLRVLGT